MTTACFVTLRMSVDRLSSYMRVRWCSMMGVEVVCLRPPCQTLPSAEFSMLDSAVVMVRSSKAEAWLKVMVPFG